jgi:hypothetical protein
VIDCGLCGRELDFRDFRYAALGLLEREDYCRLCARPVSDRAIAAAPNYLAAVFRWNRR